MKKILIKTSSLVCEHPPGKVDISSIQQDFVKIDNQSVLVSGDLMGKSLSKNEGSKCPIKKSSSSKPCKNVLTEDMKGYSSFVKVGGKQVLIESLTGATDGVLPTPPMPKKYNVQDVGQEFVGVSE